MGCGNSSDLGDAQSRAGAKIKIYGDYLSADTRGLIAVCKYADVPFDFQ